MSRRGAAEDDGLGWDAAPSASRPPWLEEAEEDAPRAGTVVSRRALWIVAGLVLLLVSGIAFGVWRIAQGGTQEYAGGEVPLIRAPDGPYKVKPADPGGMEVESADATIYSAGSGYDPGGSIDLAAMPEEPVVRPAPTVPVPVPAASSAAEVARRAAPSPPPAPQQQAAAAAPSPSLAPRGTIETKPTPKPKQPETVAIVPAKAVEKLKQTAPAPTPVQSADASSGAGTQLQLGAFSSEAKARAAWKTLSGRYGYIASLEPRVLPVERDGTTLYRLRAAGAASSAEARSLCARLKVAGENCLVAD